jgi:hypothetical protein
MATRTYLIKHEDGTSAGPVTGSQLMSMASNGSLSPGALVMVVGTERWVAAGSIPQLEFPEGSRTNTDAVDPHNNTANHETTATPSRERSGGAAAVFTNQSGSDFWKFSKMITPDVIRLLFIMVTVLLGLSLIAAPIMCLKDLGEISLSSNAEFARRDRQLDAAEETLRDAESKMMKYQDDLDSFRGRPNYTQAFQEAAENIKREEARLSAAAISLGLSPGEKLTREDIDALRTILQSEKRLVSNKRFMVIAQYAAVWIMIPLLWGLTRVLFESLIVIFRIYERLSDIQKIG